MGSSIPSYQGRRSVGPGYNIFANGISWRRYTVLRFVGALSKVASSRLNAGRGTVLCPWARQVICCLEPIQPSLDMTENLSLTGTVT